MATTTDCFIAAVVSARLSPRWIGVKSSISRDIKDFIAFLLSFFLSSLRGKN